MPAYPDRDTLRLRAPDRRPPAEAVALAARELARRPRAHTAADVRLTAADRALHSFRERYPAVAERFPAAVLWSCAHGRAQPAGKPTRRPCGWCLARAWSRRQRQAPPRVDQLARALLGDPCPGCQPVLGWHPPRPKPKPKPARTRTRAARASTASSSRRPAAAVAERARVAAFVAGGGPLGVTAAQAAYNPAAMLRMRMDPATAPHLTRPGRR